jgi:hypothetical protein
MRAIGLLAMSLICIGCTADQPIDLPTLIERYEATQLAEGTISIVPLRLDRDEPPPIVVNWFYAGTRNAEHLLVHRWLTWDDQGQPIGEQTRYTIAEQAFSIAEPMPRTENDARWLPLYEAAASIPAPSDLPSKRQPPSPVATDPITRPDPVRRPEPSQPMPPSSDD